MVPDQLTYNDCAKQVPGPGSHLSTISVHLLPKTPFIVHLLVVYLRLVALAEGGLTHMEHVLRVPRLPGC